MSVSLNPNPNWVTSFNPNPVPWYKTTGAYVKSEVTKTAIEAEDMSWLKASLYTLFAIPLLFSSSSGCTPVGGSLSGEENLVLQPEWPSSAVDGEPAYFSAGVYSLNPDTNTYEEQSISNDYSVKWYFPEENPVEGTAIEYTFSLNWQNGENSYMVVPVRVELIDNSEGTVLKEAEANIYVTRQLVADVDSEVPTVSFSAPYSAKVGSDVVVTIANPNMDNFNYSIEWGDGTEAGGDIAFVHAYSTVGTYSIKVTATSNDDPSVFAYNTQNISVVPYDLPNVSISAAHITGESEGYYISFDASGSYSPDGYAIANFELIYGDGTTDSNSSGLFLHAYPNPGAGGNAIYNAYLTITDTNGTENSTDISVLVWGE